MLKVILLGGGKVGEYLIRLLLNSSHGKQIDLHLIDIDHEVCADIASRYPIKVFHGDGASLDLLARAGTDRCDVFAALTGRDERNLLACQMAEKIFHVKHPIARVVDPRNVDSFHQLGITHTFSSTVLLSEILQNEIRYSGLYVAYDIPGTRKAIVDFQIHPDSPVVGWTLKDYEFPRDAKVVLITHSDGTVETPYGDSVMQAGDRLLLLCGNEDFDMVHQLFVQPVNQA